MVLLKIIFTHYFLALTGSRGGGGHFELLFGSGHRDMVELPSAKNQTPQISKWCLAFSVFRSRLVCSRP